MKVKFYSVDKEPTMHEIPEGSAQDELKALQALVQGYPEAVHTQRLRMAHNVALVDEQGISKGKPMNYRATLDIAYAGMLYGPVVICGEVMGSEGMEWVSYHG